jgi:hypothetical protein
VAKYFCVLPVAKLPNEHTFKGMAESKKKSAGSGSSAKSHPLVSPTTPALENEVLSQEQLEALSLLQLIDLIVAKLPPRHSALMDMVYLRDRVAEVEEINDQARQTIEKLDAVVEKLRSPAFRVGTLLMPVEPDKAHVCVSGTDYVCRIDPQLPLASLQVGQRVLLNEAFAVVQGLGFDRHGPIVRVDELLSGGRLRIGQESGLIASVLLRSALLAKEKIKPGMEVRLDANQRAALEVIGVGKRIERALETVAALPWSAIGGQDEAVQGIRDTIELPFLHRGLFKRFEHTVPKGFLLHGPPGCGKTLLGKATAYNLRQQILTETGVARQRPRDPQHVGGGIGTAGAGPIRAVPRAGGGGFAGLFVHRRGGIDFGHAAGGPLQQHSEHVGADVLLGDGRFGAAAKRGRHSGLQSGGLDRSGHFTSRQDL